MGLNRFYTYNGQILKTADGNPIGYEYFPWPTDGLIARWGFSGGSLVDSVSGRTFIPSGGTPSSVSGPGSTNAIDISGFPISASGDWNSLKNGMSLFFWAYVNNSYSANEQFVSFGNTSWPESFGYSFTDNDTNIWNTSLAASRKLSGLFRYQWMFFGFGWQASPQEIYTYINANKVDTRTTQQPVPTYTWNLFQLNYTVGQSSFLHCNLRIGPIYIYNRIISGDEMDLLYNDGAGM